MAPAPEPQQEPELAEAAASNVVDAAVLERLREKLRAERAKARQHARTILDDDVTDEGEANGR